MSFQFFQDNQDIFSDLLDTNFLITQVGNEACVDGFVALKIDYTSPKYLPNEVFEIAIPSMPADSAYLLTCAGYPFKYTTATQLETASFLAEASTFPAEIKDNYTFKSNFILIRNQHINDYKDNYQDTSNFWGGFYHTPQQFDSYKINSSKIIEANSGLSLPTQEHTKALYRANADSSAIGRYLGLFHLLELSFDYDLVQEITQIQHDLKGIGKLFASYNHSEFERLFKLTKKYWKDEPSLAKALGNFFTSSAFDKEIDDLLHGYEKDGFPWNIKHSPDKLKAFILQSRTSFDKVNFDKNKVTWSLEYLQKAATYIIYRFRCAIAHASIGEYIINLDDEEMVAEKAEPLLREANQSRV
ncbi:hypothetical protein ACSC9U_05150 [Pseudomonas solani]|uniref:hypothetical protein n=1 Tax=Pseudomonas solani TaxID=2731552 RepID=UPI003F4A9941